MAAHLLARGRLAGAQDDRDRAGGRAVVDVDRQKAALIVSALKNESCWWPWTTSTVSSIACPREAGVERHRRWRGGVAGAIEIDHHPHQANKVAQGWRVLPARDGGLRTQIDP